MEAHPVREDGDYLMSQAMRNDINRLQKEVAELREEIILLRALIATKRRTKDMMKEQRDAAH